MGALELLEKQLLLCTTFGIMVNRMMPIPARMLFRFSLVLETLAGDGTICPIIMWVGS
jgi:hypothetical protein